MNEIARTEAWVRTQMAAEPTGHDWWHAVRVRDLALRLAQEEGADPRIVELAALLHDIEDEKFSGDPAAGPAAVRAWLSGLDLDPATVSTVVDIIGAMSFTGAGVAEAPLSLEGRCVRDADRLDALGAIGIARAFAYGGFIGRPIHDPEIAPLLAPDRAAYRANLGTTINHFAEKLLLLPDRMSTTTGRRLARQRAAFMDAFLARFEREWRGES